MKGMMMGAHMMGRWFVPFLAVVLGLVCLAFDATTDARAQTPKTSVSGTYRLGPNDKVRVKVYGEPDITGEYEVDSSGSVSIPLAGRIAAAGKTA